MQERMIIKNTITGETLYSKWVDLPFKTIVIDQCGYGDEKEYKDLVGFLEELIRPGLSYFKFGTEEGIEIIPGDNFNRNYRITIETRDKSGKGKKDGS